MLLQQAFKLAPRERAILIHYSQALGKLGRTEELKAVLASFKEAAAGGAQLHPHAGLLEFLALSPEQQDARYLESLQAAVNENPNDVALKARLAEYLLDQGEEKHAAAVFQEVLAARADTATLADCGKALLEHEQYGLAADFLQKAPNARLDLAIAVFHSVSPEAGLAELDQIPAGEGAGDYFILRAQILDSMGKTAEAVDSLNRGIRAAPRRADMYF